MSAGLSMPRIVFTKKRFLNRSQRDFLEKKNLKKINFFLEIFYLKIKFITQVVV